MTTWFKPQIRTKSEKNLTSGFHSCIHVTLLSAIWQRNDNSLPFRVPPDISVPRAGAGWIGTFGAGIVTVNGSFVGEWRKTGRVAPPASSAQEHKRQPTVCNNCTYAEPPGKH